MYVYVAFFNNFLSSQLFDFKRLFVSCTVTIYDNRILCGFVDLTGNSRNVWNPLYNIYIYITCVYVYVAVCTGI